MWVCISPYSRKVYYDVEAVAGNQSLEKTLSKYPVKSIDISSFAAHCPPTISSAAVS